MANKCLAETEIDILYPQYAEHKRTALSFEGKPGSPEDALKYTLASAAFNIAAAQIRHLVMFHCTCDRTGKTCLNIYNEKIANK